MDQERKHVDVGIPKVIAIVSLAGETLGGNAHISDLKRRLENVENEGFARPELTKIAKKEPLDRWTSRDGHTQPPQDLHAFELQEQHYDPDLNDGVRVNIAPLQKAGLLAADVLNTKDVDKAIADRAEWRADERRWCREGKLPQPGWWE